MANAVTEYAPRVFSILYKPSFASTTKMFASEASAAIPVGAVKGVPVAVMKLIVPVLET